MSTPPAPPAPPWHQQPGVLSRVVHDLVQDEVARLRPAGPILPPAPWADALPLHEDGLGLDSLERMSVAAALSEALHLHEGPAETALYASRHVADWLACAARGLQHSDARRSFRSSGSTGRPKTCTHDLASLQQEVGHLCTLLSGTRRVLSAVPSHHIYGFLFTVLLPLALPGVGATGVIDIRAMSPAAVQALLREGDLLVSHPMHWDLLAGHTANFAPGVRGVTSTAPCPDALAEGLITQGLQQLLQVYGSSETAGIGWRTATGQPYTLMPFWARGDTLATDGEPTLLQRTGPDGTPTPHALQDTLVWHGEGRFHVQGRLDAAVQVGGVNVYPARVQALLRTHPLVADATVRPMAPHEGQRLKAFIVPRPEADLCTLPTELAAWVASRLSAPERPKAFTLGDRLPTNPMGKASDWPINLAGHGGA